MIPSNQTKATFYSKAELQSLQNQGVHIPSLDHICIGRDVLLDKIAAGVVLHPFCRITGKDTKIYPNAEIGPRGSVILENSMIGSDAVIGNQGSVTLVKTVAGPKTVLGSGSAEQAVFLGKETDLNDFTTGGGFRVRKGSLYEEDASSAQHTDTKMTLLFPWATLGSNVNLCDLLLAGGVGPELGKFTEIGSGTIHFNFTIRGDKATGTLLGNASSGVFLKEKRLFIGGNNCLLGPLQAEFGALSAAGLRVSGKLKAGLNLGQEFPTGHREYDPRIFLKAKAIVGNQVHYVGQLAALSQWYQMVRLSIAQRNPERCQVYQAGMQIVELNIQERIAQLERFIESLETSVQLLSEQAAPPRTVIQEQRTLLEHWPLLKKYLENYKAYFENIPSQLEQALNENAGRHSYYTKIIQNLPPSSVHLGQLWLESLVQRCEHFFDNALKR